MDEKRKSNRMWTDSRFYFCMLIIILLIYLILSSILHINGVEKEDQTEDFSNGWTYLDGAAVDFGNLREGEEVVIHRNVTREEINNRMLCFLSRNVFFSIYLDEELIYDYQPNAPKLFGKAYGSYPHSVNIPVLYQDGEFRIVINNIYPKNPGVFKEFCLDNGNQFLVERMQQSALDFLLCIIIFVFGMVLFVGGLSGKYFKEKRGELLSVGTFAMVSSVWIVCETEIFAILLRAPVAVHFMEYLSLDMMALAGVMLVTSVADYRRFHMVEVFAALTATKIIYSFYSVLSGGKDYHQLLKYTHILLATAVAAIIFIVIRVVLIGGLRNRFKRSLFIALFISVMIGAADIFVYLTTPDVNNRPLYFKYAMFLFTFILGIYEFYSISEMSRKSQYAEIMESLAYKDALTGLLNRLAYNREMEKAEKGDKSVTFIMLDMNYLKRVNDEMGHDKGDEYINKVAEIMRTVFEGDEKCFRIGGDEFFVMANYPKDDPRLAENRRRFRDLVDEFNSDGERSIPLSIAYGYSVYVPGENVAEECIREADKKMYDMKIKMKAARI